MPQMIDIPTDGWRWHEPHRCHRIPPPLWMPRHGSTGSDREGKGREGNGRDHCSAIEQNDWHQSRQMLRSVHNQQAHIGPTQGKIHRSSSGLEFHHNRKPVFKFNQLPKPLKQRQTQKRRRQLTQNRKQKRSAITVSESWFCHRRWRLLCFANLRLSRSVMKCAYFRRIPRISTRLCCKVHSFSARRPMVWRSDSWCLSETCSCALLAVTFITVTWAVISDLLHLLPFSSLLAEFRFPRSIRWPWRT